MASIARDPNGRKRILFAKPDGKRVSIRLGKTTMRNAEAVKLKIESIVSARIAGHAIDDETARWIANLDESLSEKLSNVGLIAERDSTTLAAFIDAYIDSRHDVKPNTVKNYKQVRECLLGFFDPNIQLRDITPGDADEWRLWMLKKGLGENTVRRCCGRAKQFMKAAIRRRLLSFNPFDDLKSSVQANSDLFYFVSRDEADKIIDACPDAQWRLLFALSRYGGLRCPSEHLSLKWGDVDCERGRINVRSPKTEHHAGGDSRWIPLFPELRPHLAEVFALAEDGQEYVITRYRDTNSNLRTQLLRIIKRAGLTKWPKLFQNLRSTRETELAEEFPLHVVCAWIGNSQPVAAKHYLQVTDEHFTTAAADKPEEQTEGGAKSGAVNCEMRRIEPKRRNQRREETAVLQGITGDYDSLQSEGVPPQGIEP